MLKKRIIPCLDIMDGRTVKGVNFLDIRDAGDPVELARRYVGERADELVFLDITATVEKRKILADLVSRIAAEINIPFTVGGGIETVEDAGMLIRAGADKITINTAAYRNPGLISSIAKQFGRQCVVVAIDTAFTDNEWKVFIEGGRTATTSPALDWAVKAESCGAGEILLTSMNSDGTKSGFSIGITRDVVRSLSIPVIASGGAGTPEHFREVFSRTSCSAALAASIFHYGEVAIPELKRYLSDRGVNVRV